MKRFLIVSLAAAILACVTGCATSRSSAHSRSACDHKGNTYVIVHGAWGGGWDWKNVGNLLTADGNIVYRPTLSGMGEHCNFTSTNIDLSTHIQDIVNVILWQDLHDVVLVGHSYGGMVITGVADRVPDRIKHMVYIDALLPTNGESVDSMMSPNRRPPATDGFIVPTWVKPNTPPPHDVPQPVLTFTQPITLTNQAVAEKIPTTYILTVEKGKLPKDDDFYRFYERAKARGWTTLIMTGNHVVERSHPREVARLLDEAP